MKKIIALLLIILMISSITWAIQSDQYKLADRISIQKYSNNLATAISSIGYTDNRELDINTIVTLAADCNVPDNILVRVTKNGLITQSDPNFTLIIHRFEGGNYRCFGDPNHDWVTFGPEAASVYRPIWFGAHADSGTTSGATNAKAFARCIASLPASPVKPVIEFESGQYYLAGDPAINITRSGGLYIRGNNGQLFYEAGQTGTVLKIDTSNVQIDNLKLTRGYSYDGSTDPNDTLKGTGIWFADQGAFLGNLIYVDGFKKGLRFEPETGGCSYSNLYGTEVRDCLTCVYIDCPDVINAYTTNIHFFGGNLATYPSYFLNVNNCRLLDIKQTSSYHAVNGCTFDGVTIEQAVERKIRCAGEYCRFSGIYFDPGAFDAGSHPYEVNLTNCSTASGSVVITKSSHGASVVNGDLVLITDAPTTATDEGYYVVIDSNTSSITVERNFYGIDPNVDLTIYRANIEFTSESQNCVMAGGENLSMQAITDRGTNNQILDPELGISCGSAMPTLSRGVASTTRRALFDFRENYGGNVYGYFDNAYDDAGSGDINIDFRALDGYDTLRTMARIKCDKINRDNRSVTGRIDFNVARGGAYNAGTTQGLAFSLNNDSDGSIAFSATTSGGNYGGILKLWPYQNDDLADDGTVSLPNATNGMAFACVSDPNGIFTSESGMWQVSSDGTVQKISGSTNTAATNTDANLCVYDGGTYAILKNRMGNVGIVRMFYFYY